MNRGLVSRADFLCSSRGEVDAGVIVSFPLILFFSFGSELHLSPTYSVLLIFFTFTYLILN